MSLFRRKLMSSYTPFTLATHHWEGELDGGWWMDRVRGLRGIRPIDFQSFGNVKYSEADGCLNIVKGYLEAVSAKKRLFDRYWRVVVALGYTDLGQSLAKRSYILDLGSLGNTGTDTVASGVSFNQNLNSISVNFKLYRNDSNVGQNSYDLGNSLQQPTVLEWGVDRVSGDDTNDGETFFKMNGADVIPRERLSAKSLYSPLNFPWFIGRGVTSGYYSLFDFRIKSVKLYGVY